MAPARLSAGGAGKGADKRRLRRHGRGGIRRLRLCAGRDFRRASSRRGRTRTTVVVAVASAAPHRRDGALAVAPAVRGVVPVCDDAAPGIVGMAPAPGASSSERVRYRRCRHHRPRPPAVAARRSPFRPDLPTLTLAVASADAASTTSLANAPAAVALRPPPPSPAARAGDSAEGSDAAHLFPVVPGVDRGGVLALPMADCGTTG